MDSHDPNDATGGEVPVEYRGVPRFRVLQRCVARLAGSAAPQDWRVIVYDISATGIGVTLTLPLQAGTMLEIEPWELPGGKPVRARVVRSSPLEFIWLCGCELETRLSRADLDAWLAKAPVGL